MRDLLYNAGCEVAAGLKKFSWYHRTTTVTGDSGIAHIAVWIEWDHEGIPPEIPPAWNGYLVIVNRVNDKYPCPFGSVKPFDQDLESRRYVAGLEDAPGFD